MLVVLPLLTFLLLFIHALGERLGVTGDQPDPRGPFILALIGWGLLVAVFSEGLGALGQLNRTAIALAWLAACTTLLALGLRRGSLAQAARDLRTLKISMSSWETGIVAGVAVLLLALLAVALAAPPNNVDSLLYHMPRVMHWAQNGSLEHYATGHHHQLRMPPWSEMAILNLRILWGSDRPANLVQWFSMVGSLVGVSAVGSRLGAGALGQLISVAFAVTIPMGVIQSTSTQNDYSVALWLVSTVYLVTLGRGRSMTTLESLSLGACVGLGMLTKVTYPVYAAPVLGWFLIHQLRRNGVRRAAIAALAIGLIAAALNLGVWIRNLATYGGLYGAPEAVGPNLALQGLLDTLGTATMGQGNGSQDWAARAGALADAANWSVGRVAQAAALNLVTPSSWLNELIWRILDSFPGIFDQVVENSLRQAAWSHEDTAGNPLHFLLVALSLGLLLFGGRRRAATRKVLPLATAVGLGFVLLPLAISWASSGFGIRYQLPLFVAWAPFAGLAAEVTAREHWAIGAGLFMLVSAVPYALYNNTRPIIGHPPWPTRTGSVFAASQAELLFAANPDKRGPLAEVTDRIGSSGCREIGLRLDSGDLEYQIWWLLDAPQSGFRLETIHTYASLEHLLDPDFRPCAVICTICGEQEVLGDLRMEVDLRGVRLYSVP